MNSGGQSAGGYLRCRSSFDVGRQTTHILVWFNSVFAFILSNAHRAKAITSTNSVETC
jgi:hypothetical protein